LQRAFEAAGPRLLTEGLVLPYHLFFDALPSAHLQFFRELQPFFQADGLLCSHGGAELQGKPARDTDSEHLIWGVTGWPEQYVGAGDVVYGHWDSAVLDASGWPRPHMPGNRTYGVDTVSHGVLTALRFPDLKVVQSARHRN
jgi:diadenosine tetraphosphatase ApaH/serine/threonine PP2A family protein phosphatase